MRTILIAAVSVLLASSCGSADDAAVVSGDAGSVSGSSNDTSPGIPSLVDLGSTTCVPCKMMVDELAMLDSLTGDGLDIRFIDVNESPDEASDYGVRLIPTQVFISESGEELFRHEGFISCNDIMALWMELGYSFGNGD